MTKMTMKELFELKLEIQAVEKEMEVCSKTIVRAKSHLALLKVAKQQKYKGLMEGITK